MVNGEHVNAEKLARLWIFQLVSDNHFVEYVKTISYYYSGTVLDNGFSPAF